MDTLLDRVFDAHPESLAAVRAALRPAAESGGMDAEGIEELVLAVNEACMNIIQHGYSFADEQQFRVCMLRDGAMLHVRLFDSGKKATLDSLRPRALEDLRPGGLGVRFMREVTDDVAYLAPPDGYSNLLQLSKRIRK